MSLAEIKAEIDKLSPEEIAQLKRDLLQGALDDPTHVAELTRRVDEMEAGRHVVTREAVLRRAGELGISP